MTTILNLHAAGDIARMPRSVSWTVANAVTAATSVDRALVLG
jgi:NADPH-dependent glutamate synthase beta subunit-like oxidoreductase